MASPRVIAMKQAQAAEASANALNEMTELVKALRDEIKTLHDKVDALTAQHTPDAMFTTIEAEVKRRNLSFSTPANATKRAN